MSMDLSLHYRRLENMMASAPICQFTRARVKVEEGRAEIVLPVKRDFFHAAGALHGSLIYMALDSAAFCAAGSLEREVYLLTTAFHLHLLRPVNEGEISAMGTVVARARMHIIAESVAYDHKRREIARGSGTFVPSKLPLNAQIGYA